MKNKYHIEKCEGGVIIRTLDGSYWDTRLGGGAGSLEPYAREHLLGLVAMHGPGSVADAISALGVYPPKIDARDAQEIEDAITWVD